VVKFKSFQFENQTTPQTTGQVFCWSLQGEQTEPTSDQCFTLQLCLNNNPNKYKPWLFGVC